MTRTKSSRALLSVVLAVLMVAAFMPALTYSSFAATAKKATKVTKTTHNGTRVYGKVGKKYVLKYKLSPSKLTSAAKKVVWKSSDSSVVKVYSTNTNRAAVKVKGVGTAKVTVYTKANKKAKATWTFKTKAAAAKVAATGVTVKANNTTDDITKTLSVGTELTATVAPANATGVTYQWYADGTAIDGATSANFTVTAAQIGKAITVKATDDSKNTVESAKTAAVSNVKISALNLTGTAKVGETLTVKGFDPDNKEISDSVLSNAVDVQWYRTKTSLVNGNKATEAISGATGTTYKITDADAGYSIYAVVTPKTGTQISSTILKDGKVTLNNTDVVPAAGNEIRAVKIQINGKDADSASASNAKTYDAGSVLTAVVTPTAAASSVDYQWYQDGYKISGATSATYTAATSGTYTVKISLKSTDMNYKFATNATKEASVKVKASKEFTGVTLTNVNAANDSKRTDKTVTYAGDTLGVQVSGVAASNYTVEWHYVTKDQYGDAVDHTIKDQTGITYTVNSPVAVGDQVYAVVNGQGTQYADYTGKTSALTVSKTANTTTSATVGQDDKTVKVNNLPTGAKVQLQKQTVSSIGVESAWADISGATSTTYELTTDDYAAIKAGTVKVRAKVTDANGNVAYTDAITLVENATSTPEAGEK